MKLRIVKSGRSGGTMWTLERKYKNGWRWESTYSTLIEAEREADNLLEPTVVVAVFDTDGPKGN